MVLLKISLCFLVHILKETLENKTLLKFEISQHSYDLKAYTESGSVVLSE